jgi:hypothetical protein
MSVAASAQTAHSVRLSGFLIDSADTPQYSAHPGSDLAYGGGLEYFAVNNVSLQLAASSERTVSTSFSRITGFPSARFERIHPIDATARFHLGQSSWKPFLGAGARYIRVAGHDNWHPELAGGLTFEINSHFGIDLEAKQFFNQRRREPTGPLGSIPVHDGDYDQGRSRRLSAGLGWRF